MTGLRRGADRSSYARGLFPAVVAALLALSGCTGADDTDPTVPTELTTQTVTPSPSVPADAAETTARAPSPTTQDPESEAFGAYGVAAGHELAVDAGMQLLEQGGNAVDAAVGVAFSMAVVEPLTSGPGGGGAALVVPMPDSTARGNPAEALAYDYREVVQSSGQVTASGTGIPGFVAGLALVHGEHGVLPWEAVLAPAINQAADGVPVSWFVAQELRTDAGRLATSGLPQFSSDGDPLAEGDLLVQADLAETLRAIADDPAWFYTGALSGELAQLSGIDEAGLAAYEVDVRSPPQGAVGDYQVLSTAPALSGAALIQLLQVAQAAGAGEVEAGSADFVDLLTHAWVVADDSIQTVLGDPNFVDVPVGELTDPENNAGIVADLDIGLAPADAAGEPPTAGNTTHLSVVDADGLVVSMSNTVTRFWGSRQEVGGFFINDHLIRFTTGRTSANEPEAGRRPVSYMAPAVLLDDQDRPVLVIGSPGGRRIPNIQAEVITRWALLGQPLQEAVDAPRFHLEGDQLQVEELPGATVSELSDRGYAITRVPLSWSLFGSVQALELDHSAGELTGAVDERRTAAWASAS